MAAVMQAGITEQPPVFIYVGPSTVDGVEEQQAF